MNPVPFSIHPDARARMRLLSEMLKDNSRRVHSKTNLGTGNDPLLSQSDESTEESPREDRSDST